MSVRIRRRDMYLATELAVAREQTPSMCLGDGQEHIYWAVMRHFKEPVCVIMRHIERLYMRHEIRELLENLFCYICI